MRSRTLPAVAKFKREPDSLAEGSGFELSVPPFAEWLLAI
jgi:hypothetical protein